MIVVDATIWVDRLCGTLPEELAALIRAEGCAAPAHVDFEVGSGLLRLERRGMLAAGRAAVLIEEFSRHPVERIGQAQDFVRATGLLDNSSYADALYLALAERLDCPLLTSDAGMKAAARVASIPVVDATIDG
ncbi:type II toxin-antitoxin system VapC family toxin [Jiangella gansuensis]|uniref:type II toxin-antitoxin system VapC family toxin n=1 Tax=Jiangella gansuensis TaxID=281473 RepID=UPI0004B305AB|nr:type II toxin-antitoxin system VapC family toxin [Jiangella gansuensis]